MATVSNKEIIDKFLASTGTDYETRIPEAVRDNITAVGNAIMAYQPLQNEFLDTIVNKIALTLVTNMVSNNKFAALKGEQITYGDTIEDLYVDAIQGLEFKGAQDTPPQVDQFEVFKPTVVSLYHKIDRELQYIVTISDVQLRRAFRTTNGLQHLIDGIIATLYQSKEWDEFTMVKELLNHNFVNAGQVITLTGTDKKTLSTDLLYQIKKVSKRLEFVSRDYNKSEVANLTTLDNQLLVMDVDYNTDIDMDVLAGIYNLDKVALGNKIITVDNFNSNTNKIVAVLIDKRGIRIHDSLFDMETARNARGKYTNYILTLFQLMSFAFFHNAIYFVEPTA